MVFLLLVKNDQLHNTHRLDHRVLNNRFQVDILYQDRVQFHFLDKGHNIRRMENKEQEKQDQQDNFRLDKLVVGHNLLDSLEPKNLPKGQESQQGHSFLPMDSHKLLNPQRDQDFQKDQQDR